MESNLKVKNFGPIKSVDLKLKDVNVFIGPQSTGKSALAKLYTIFKAPRKFFYKKNDSNEEIIIDGVKTTKEVNDVFREYNINSFLNAQTEIVFDSALHKISYKNGILNYEPKFLKEIRDLELLVKDFNTNREQIVAKIKFLDSKFVYFSIRANAILYPENNSGYIGNNWENDLLETSCTDLLKILKSLEDEISTSASIYIPAERNFINIIKKYALNLILNKVPIPEHILSFGAELEKLDLKEIDLDFIQKDLKYRIIEGEDRIFINDNDSIMLTEAASGIQSVVPLIASVSKSNGFTHRSYVIEEPELNLFPIAQYELVKFLESNRKEPYSMWEDYGTLHTYTTHSPYILSSLNNLLYAHKVLNKLNSQIMTGNSVEDFFENNQTKVKSIVKATINPKSFTAYQILNGYAESIFNETTELIEDNYIDMATDKINEDFETLMELMK